MWYTKKHSPILRGFILMYGMISALALVFVLGLVMGRRTVSRVEAPTGGQVENQEAPPSYLLENVDFKLFWEVWNLVKDKYVDQPVLDTKLFYGALSGMMAALGDPYSVFLDPETTGKFTQELSGTFSGIGAEIGIKKEQLVIIAPLPDTPAKRAGLKSTDAILMIDKKDTLGMPLDVAVFNIRGLKGTPVTLKIFRKGWKEPRDITIVREEIHVNPVRVEELKNGIIQLKITHFSEQLSGAFEQAVQDILAKNPKGLILDLRNNPGGFFEGAVDVASEWIAENQVVVYQQDQSGKKQEFPASGPARFKDIPTVVLVNEGSASASEIVAGALKDYQIAKVVGEKTFGKGSVQTFEQLRGGSAAKITVAHWLTPQGIQIDKEGIVPDLEVKMGKDDAENGDDPQLEKAVELLTK